MVSVPKDRSSTGASGKYSEAEAKTVKHHSAEIAAFRKAIDSLLDAHDTRIVICDILERDKGVIKDILVSHSVVLYKNPADSSGKHQVVVIDPSNFQHSSHLASEDMIRESASASGLIHRLLSGIKTFHKGTQIYKPFTDNVGSSHSQYRDCVDLAVKLAFGLAQSRGDLSFGTIDDIKNNEIVTMFSNQLDKTSLSVAPTRLKQSSDLGLVVRFHELQDSLFAKLNTLSAISEHAHSRIEMYDDLITNATAASDSAVATIVSTTKLSKSSTLSKYQAIVDCIQAKTEEIKTTYGEAWNSAYIDRLEALEAELLGSIIPNMLAELDS